MSSENPYRRFAVSSVNSIEGVTDPSDKVGLLIMAEAWLDLAEQKHKWWITKLTKPIPSLDSR
jgi:hypothetical protein